MTGKFKYWLEEGFVKLYFREMDSTRSDYNFRLGTVIISPMEAFNELSRSPLSHQEVLWYGTWVENDDDAWDDINDWKERYKNNHISLVETLTLTTDNTNNN